MDHTKALQDAAAKLEQAHAARDTAILAAHAAGMGPTAIAAAVGLTRVHVSRIVNAPKKA